MNYKEFLKTTLPQLGLRWRRFNRKSIRKRIIGRLQELNLHSLGEYHAYLLNNKEERRHLTTLLTVTISRFWRNADLFEALETTWLPSILARLSAGEPLRIWSVGCASGEEPYSLLILWEERFADSDHELRLLASDSDSRCLERALLGHYPASSFREMPIHLRQKYCTNEGGTFSLPHDFPNKITLVEHNLIWDPPNRCNKRSPTTSTNRFFLADFWSRAARIACRRAVRGCFNRDNTLSMSVFPKPISRLGMIFQLLSLE
jgi:chemotaxis methyl-accepting protein methylase